MSKRYTSQVIVSENGEVARGSCPVQIIFCLKEKNKKKRGSYRGGEITVRTFSLPLCLLVRVA